jgi:hypothetical protein
VLGALRRLTEGTGSLLQWQGVPGSAEGAPSGAGERALGTGKSDVDSCGPWPIWHRLPNPLTSPSTSPSRQVTGQPELSCDDLCNPRVWQ